MKFKNSYMRTFSPSFRENDSVYMLRQAQFLIEKAKEHLNSNFLVYAALEARLSLEKLDLDFILASVDEEDRLQIQKESKRKHGIKRANKQVGILKERYQLFFKAVSEIIELPVEIYSIRDSLNLQHELSEFIHSYHFEDEDVRFGSEKLNKIPILVSEVEDFIKRVTCYDGSTYRIGNFQICSMPSEDKDLLNNWKNDSKYSYEQLKKELGENLMVRQNVTNIR